MRTRTTVLETDISWHHSGPTAWGPSLKPLEHHGTVALRGLRGTLSCAPDWHDPLIQLMYFFSSHKVTRREIEILKFC